jgi:hypothetical protein
MPASAANAQTARCCQSDRGPDPVPYTGNWLNQQMTRDRCVAVRYGFWDGDTPNVARQVCALREEEPPTIPGDPVPPPGDGGGGNLRLPDDRGGGEQRGN